MIIPPVIPFREGLVEAALRPIPGGVEVLVRLADGDGGAVPVACHPALAGEVARGDRVVVGALPPGDLPQAEPRRVIVAAARGPHGRLAAVPSAGLAGLPVACLPMGAMLPAAAAGASAAGAEHVVWVTPAADPDGLDLVAGPLVEGGLLAAVAVAEPERCCAALLGAQGDGADVVLVADAPGAPAAGGARAGAAQLAPALWTVAAAALGGRPVAGLPLGAAPWDAGTPLPRGTLDALAEIVPEGTHVAVPSLEEGPERAALWAALVDAGLHVRHQLVDVTGEPAARLVAARGLVPPSGTRDPSLLAAGAAGVLGGRMAARDRFWRRDSAGRARQG